MYGSVFSPTAGKCGPEQLQIWTLFMQCLCLLLTHIEIVFRGTRCFLVTFLFDNPFSRSFKALPFSVKDLFVSFSFTGAIFLKKTSDEKLKTFVMYFLPKN